MNIVYATRATIPYASAASLNSVQMCESLVDLGHRVTLAIGRKFWRRTTRACDWLAYYGFQPRFDIARLWEVPRSGWGFDTAIWQLAARRRALLYSRFPRILRHRLAGSAPMLLEIHSGLSVGDRSLVASALKQGSLNGVIVITAALRNDLLSYAELRPFAGQIHVAPDAVDGHRFARVSPHLNLEHLGYIGGLFPGKGMEQILQIAALRPNLAIHIYGGRAVDVRRWKRAATGLRQLRLWGHVAPASVPECLEQFGIALLPNQPSIRLPNGDDIGRYTSPMKLFEYMAAGRAIIASDLPTLREILTHEVNCLLVRHDDPHAWVDAIDRLRSEPQLAQRLATQARREALGKYSYNRRFRAILAHFEASIRRDLWA